MRRGPRRFSMEPASRRGSPPRTAALGVLRGQVRYGSKRCGGPARHPHRNEQAALAGGLEVAANRSSLRRSAVRQGQVPRPQGFAEGQCHQPCCHPTGVDRLPAKPGRHRDGRKPCEGGHRRQGEVVERGRPHDASGDARAHDQLLGGTLGADVAEHGAVDSAHDRSAVGTDDGDVDEVLGSRPRRCVDQSPVLTSSPFAEPAQ